MSADIAQVYCQTCPREVWGTPRECRTCSRRVCAHCYRECTTCDVGWCLVHAARSAVVCTAARFSWCDPDCHVHDAVIPNIYCHACIKRCGRCGVAVCDAHQEELKNFSDDEARLLSTECARCMDQVCRACSVQCSSCGVYECGTTCARPVMWQDEAPGADYLCRGCRHTYRRIGDQQSDSE